MSSYEFSPSARDDLRSIAEYVRDAAGPEIATQLIKRIRNKCELLAETSGELGTPREDLADGVRSSYVQPYVLFFRYSTSALEVVRVLHERRDVERVFDSER